MVLFGSASGPAPEFQPELLNKKGCLYLTRPSVFPHNSDADTLLANAAEVFKAMEAGLVRASIAARLPLEEVAEAHHLAEARAIAGAIVMRP